MAKRARFRTVRFASGQVVKFKITTKGKKKMKRAGRRKRIRRSKRTGRFL